MSRGTPYLSCCLLVLTLLEPSRPEPGVQKCLVPDGAGAWNPNPTSERVEVTWDIGNKSICHTRDVCNGTQPEQNSTVIRTQDIETIILLDNATRLEPEVTSEQPPEMLVQLLPREMQLGNVLIFTPSQDMGFPFSMMVYAVDEQGFQHCNWSSGRAILSAETNTSFEVSQEFLPQGVHYFIAHSEYPAFSLCQFGLRLRVTVKSSNCEETHSAICNGWGVCITYPNQPSFFCQFVGIIRAITAIYLIRV
ncbi:protein eyes shut homolog [Physella acuta]|uniref:protein eyes shut homolog n=1 Tax=Physella acuta TaxID=109671 RepID=UPI0027DBEB13|nr:protein eyes shut homolog [Physella acuta]